MNYRALMLGSLLLVAAGPARPAPAPKQLKIVRPLLYQYDGGPPLSPGFKFLVGDELFLSFQIGGYQVSEDSKIDLGYTVEALDPDGTPFAEPTAGKVAAQVSPEDKDWLPIVRANASIPSQAWGGTYKLRLSVEDHLSKQTAKAEMDVPVRGRNIEPSPTLTVRNFRFLRSEADSDPLLDAVYHPGDSVWVRFEFTGYRYGPENHVHAEYGVELLDSSGKSLFSQPQAAVEDEGSLYPKRYLSGALSLNLDKKIQAGQYVVVLTLRDYVGNQTQETRHDFRVE